MQEHTLRELDRRIADRLEHASIADTARLAEAYSIAADVSNDMVVEGKALVITDEEERLLRSFRRFKLRMRKDGEVFKWQTRRAEGVQVVTDTAEIVSPEEIVSLEEARVGVEVGVEVGR